MYWMPAAQFRTKKPWRSLSRSRPASHLVNLVQWTYYWKHETHRPATESQDGELWHIETGNTSFLCAVHETQQTGIPSYHPLTLRIFHVQLLDLWKFFNRRPTIATLLHQCMFLQAEAHAKCQVQNGGNVSSCCRKFCAEATVAWCGGHGRLGWGCVGSLGATGCNLGPDGETWHGLVLISSGR